MEPSRGHSHREGGFQTRPYARAAAMRQTRPVRIMRREGPPGGGPCRQRSRHVVSSVFGGVHKGRLYKRI